MNRIFVDMDGVLVDFEGTMAELGLSGDELKCRPGGYASMQPYKDALAGVASLIGMGYELWVATKPPTGIAHAYEGKAAWVLEHLPQLKRRIIITHDKGLLGDVGDFLIDDRPHRANCEKFSGTLIPFGPKFGVDWNLVLAIFRDLQAKTKARVEGIADRVEAERNRSPRVQKIGESQEARGGQGQPSTEPYRGGAEVPTPGLGELADLSNVKGFRLTPPELVRAKFEIADGYVNVRLPHDEAQGLVEHFREAHPAVAATWRREAEKLMPQPGFGPRELAPLDIDVTEGIERWHGQKFDHPRLVSTWSHSIEQGERATRLLDALLDRCFHTYASKLDWNWDERNPLYEADRELHDALIEYKSNPFRGDGKITLLEPIDMVLYCPCCNTQHIDAPEEVEYVDEGIPTTGTTWSNPPHRTHQCGACGFHWRPADVPTNGVAAIQTRGKRDSELITERRYTRMQVAEAAKRIGMSMSVQGLLDTLREVAGGDV